MNESKDMLEEAIERSFEDLKNLDAGSEERKTAVEDLAKLYRLKIDENKADDEVALKETEQDLARQTKDDDRKEQRREHWVRVGIAGGEIILPLAFYAFWLQSGFKFEETGVFTSPTFKGLTKWFKPKK
ncbi:MAG: hypothetical protein LUG25_03555 [Oscillospiraceae bacterium]|nr:hypothetical protein [Oscillospiraceae bacterium]